MRVSHEGELFRVDFEVDGVNHALEFHERIFGDPEVAMRVIGMEVQGLVQDAARLVRSLHPTDGDQT